MIYYTFTSDVGLDLASSKGDGVTVNLKWFQAYSSEDKKIAYHLYYSTEEKKVFSEGIKFISFDGYLDADIFDLDPGQLYYFSVRPVEYDDIIVAINQLQNYSNTLKVYPKTLLREDIGDSDLIIPLLDVNDFPDYGIIKIGVELIQYLSVDRVNNNLILSSVSNRGFYKTTKSIHQTDGYDGVRQRDPDVSFIAGLEATIYDRIYPCQSKIDVPHYAFTSTDGYKQITKDLLTSDLSASDSYNQDFNSYDYNGWHRTDPVKLISGECVGSYLSGEQFCADGYGTRSTTEN